VLTDTTERSPTFMVPPFRRNGDHGAPVSWGFVKDPAHATPQAWEALLRRKPRGLNWTRSDYQRLRAPSHLQASPPQLDNTQIYRFRIGNEPDPSRTDGPDSALVAVGFAEEMAALCQAATRAWGRSFRKTAAICIGTPCSPPGVTDVLHVPCEVTDSPLQICRHLAVKLVLNTLSTATMARMGRVLGNAMVWVSPSNKKLVDRGCRLIARTTGCTYEHACQVLFRVMDEVEARSSRGEQVASPVALAIQEIGQPT